jgi:hypothetical protein
MDYFENVLDEAIKSVGMLGSQEAGQKLGNPGKVGKVGNLDGGEKAKEGTTALPGSSSAKATKGAHQGPPESPNPPTQFHKMTPASGFGTQEERKHSDQARPGLDS